MKKVKNGYIPDLGSRYFIEDFECGTFYIRDTARLNGIDTPVIDRVCQWYENLKTYKEEVNMLSEV